MKRVVFVISLVLLILLMAACSNETKLENVLSEVDLTDREKFLMSSTSDYSFVFDFHVDKKYKQISVWVDQYEFGELVGQKLNQLTTEIEENGTILFAASTRMGEQESITFNLSVESNNASSRSTTNSAVVVTNQSTWGNSPLERIPITDDIVLATISNSNGNGMSSLSTEFYRDLESRLSEIVDYDVVYVLRSEFHE